MISKDQLADAMLRECDIIKHLQTKLDPENLDYRPSPEQRSTRELLQYLSVVGIAASRCMAAADWKLFREFSERAETVTFEGFPAAMDEQKKELRALFDGFDEKLLETQAAPLPGGGEAPLGLAILGGPFKWLTAYKLQLFLYAKACGATELGTANAWAGVDPKPAD